MTRQIATAILLATFLTMVTGGLLTYWTARQTLLSELDQTLTVRALAALPRHNAADRTLPPPSGDRFIIENDRGQTLARSAPLESGPPPTVVSRAFTHGADGERMRTLAFDVATEGGPLRIVYSSPAGAFDRLQSRLAWTIVGTIAAGVLVTIATAVAVSRRVTRPLHRTSEVIADVNESTLDRRIDPADVPTELKPMVGRLNQMLARLDEAFERQRRFLSDAAHELRTPVAAMRAACEIALARPRTAEHMAGVARRTLQETLHLARIVEGLLESARTNAPQPSQVAEFDLVALLADCVEQVRPLASGRSQTVEFTPPDRLIVRSEEAALRAIVTNLLTNAIAYGHVGGWIRVAAHAVEPAQVQVEVSDDGPGIAPEHLERVFEPFYRADAARSPDEHLGLGLHIVRGHVTRLGGRVSVRSTVGNGTTFSVVLPTGMQAARTTRSDLGDPAGVAIARPQASLR